MDPQTELTPVEIWGRTFQRIQRSVNNPAVWLAMQASRPLILEGNLLIVGMPRDVQYLAVNLQTHEYAAAIDEALAEVAGRPLQLKIVDGATLAEWRAQRAEETASDPDAGMIGSVWGGDTFDEEVAAAEKGRAAEKERAAAVRATPPPAPVSRPKAVEEPVETIENWDRLNERLTLAFKRAPLARYPHGQAAFLLHAVKLISATMDHFMNAPFGQADPIQERALAKAIERLGVTVSLDPLFISLELIRYRRDQGKNIGVIPPP